MKNTALITGATSGIGYEFARLHAAAGDYLILVARNAGRLDEIKSELESEYSVKVLTIKKDLSIPGASAELFGEVQQHGLRVDYLINNAGFGDFGYFSQSDWNKQQRMINLNVLALAHLTRLFIPPMIQQGAGKILNVASVASFVPGPTMSVYFASKAFVLSFSEALAEELSGKNITVTALCPGPTESNFHKVSLGDREPAKGRKMPSSAEVAMYGYRAMLKGRRVAVPGLDNKFLVFAMNFLPRSFAAWAVGKIQRKKYSI